MISAAKLARMIVRVDPELNTTLVDLAARLLEETRVEHSHASIIRGLVALGLASITDAVTLAPSFVGVRVPRGRKAGTRSRTRTTAADAGVVLDLEHHEDEAEAEEGGER